jgi:rRNA-processing protein FCF1
MLKQTKTEDIIRNYCSEKSLLVIIDTSVLMAIGTGRPSLESLLNVFDEKPVFLIPKPVLQELEKHLHNHRFSIRSKASVAKQIIEQSPHEFYIIEDSKTGNADDVIYNLTLTMKRTGCKVAVATLDKNLRKRTKDLGAIPVFLRKTENRFESV